MLLKNWLNILNNKKSKLPIIPVTSTSYITKFKNLFIAKLDSGASKHYMKEEHTQLLSNVKKIKDGPITILPNEEIFKATAQGILHLHKKLSNTAQTAFIFPKLTNESLISVWQLCDTNWKVCYDKNTVNIIKNNNTILQGHRNTQDGLWDVDITNNTKQNNIVTTSSSTNAVNYIITKDKSKSELAQYLHSAAFSPTISTFQKAINNGIFLTWPGIENINFDKFIKTSRATELGHLDQERKNLPSTTAIPDDDFFATTYDTKENELYTTILPTTKVSNKNVVYADLTGRFPHKSTRSNQYLLVVYDYDSNVILFNPSKTRQA